MLTYIAVTQEISKASFIQYNENLCTANTTNKSFWDFPEKKKMYKAIVNYRPLKVQNR